MVRAPRIDQFGMKKGAWSEDEDNKLRNFIAKYGHKNWCELPRLAGLSRCGRSCRLRWMNYLRPNIKHGNFTKQEEDVIIGLHNKFGNKWSLMAARLPGRSDNEIKNHWHTHLKHQPIPNDEISTTEFPIDQEEVGKPNEPINSSKPATIKTEGCSSMKIISNLKIQVDEVGILLAVLSSSDHESPSSSLTSKSSSSCLSNGSDCVASSDHHATPHQFSGLAGTFWTEPFLLDSESVIVSSSDHNMYLSPLSSMTNNFIPQQVSNIMADGTDVLSWSSTMDSYF